MSKKERVVLFWFRRDLRLEDNAGLFYALQEKTPILPLFIFDRKILDNLEEEADPRVQFILDSVKKIHRQLKDYDSSIHVEYGFISDVFKNLIDRYEIESVYTNRDYEPYAIERDNQIENQLKNVGTGFYSFKDQVIFEKQEILNDSGEPYKVFTPYKKRWLEQLRTSKTNHFDYSLKTANFLKCSPKPIPQLQEMGFEPSLVAIPANEIKQSIIISYDKNRDFPAKDATSRLGIHLRHGTISIRKAIVTAQNLNETWLNELIWREFYMMILANFPAVVNSAFKKHYDQIPWRNDAQEFYRWCQGQTGYPIVDAGMHQLNQTGYMHNRVRMISASFLTKHLLIDWRWGEAYFARKLLDYELSANNGGWQWAAGTGTDAQPYFRIFNPWSQAEKFDPKLEYIKKWLPEFDSNDYPDPVVDHKKARQLAIDTYKKAVS